MWFYHYYLSLKASSEDETMKQIRIKSGSLVQLQLQREDTSPISLRITIELYIITLASVRVLSGWCTLGYIESE